MLAAEPRPERLIRATLAGKVAVGGQRQVQPEILTGDCREILPTLPAESVQCVITSPPYYQLRDYGVEGQIGLEETPELYLETMVDVFRHVRRVMRVDATLWCNMGDSYASAWPCRRRNVVGNGSLENGKRQDRAPRLGFALKDKDLMLMPYRLAIALQSDGWYVRSAITLAKNNPMPESVTDRPTSATEMLFLLTKQASYFYDADAIREPHKETSLERWKPGTPKVESEGSKNAEFSKTGWGQTRVSEKSGDLLHPAGRNRRNWWVLNSQPLADAHFATFPEALVEPCIKAGTSEWGCCAACGAPWKRVVEKQYHSEPDYKRSDETTLTEGRNRNVTRMGDGVDVRTIGWEPTCACDTDQVEPCVCLDPFGGSGTVGKVATKLGRRSILIELNPSYVEIAQKRNAQLGLGV